MGRSKRLFGRPSKGFQWLLIKFAGLTEWWLFYPLLSFAVGLAVGLWVDGTLRSRASARSRELRTLGYDIVDFADWIGLRAERTIYAWPERIRVRLPDLQSLLIRIGKHGYWTPRSDILHLGDKGRSLQGYLKFVGTLLVDGHVDAALQEVNNFKAEYGRQVPQIDGNQG